MNNRPKRRKSKDNPYTLVIKNNKYYVLFKDSLGVKISVEISRDVYNAFDAFELEDKSEMNEYDNHIEHNVIYENKLYNRSIIKPNSIDNIVNNSIDYEILRNALNGLTDIQRNRIKKYFFENKNIYDIAKEENTTHQAVSKSLGYAVKKLRKILKNKI